MHRDWLTADRKLTFLYLFFCLYVFYFSAFGFRSRTGVHFRERANDRTATAKKSSERPLPLVRRDPWISRWCLAAVLLLRRTSGVIWMLLFCLFALYVCVCVRYRFIILNVCPPIVRNISAYSMKLSMLSLATSCWGRGRGLSQLTSFPPDAQTHPLLLTMMLNRRRVIFCMPTLSSLKPW